MRRDAEDRGVGGRLVDNQQTVAGVADAARAAGVAGGRPCHAATAGRAGDVLAGDVRAGIVVRDGFHRQSSPCTRLGVWLRAWRAATSGTQVVGYADWSTSSVGASAPRASRGTVLGVRRAISARVPSASLS